MILMTFRKSYSVPRHGKEQLYILLGRVGIRFTLETERADLIKGFSQTEGNL